MDLFRTFKHSISILIFIAFLTLQGYSQEKIDIDKQLEEYRMHLKKKDEDPINLDIKLANKTMDGLKGLRSRLNIFREACKALYDPTVSPFNLTKAESSDPKSFTASTNPGGKAGDYSIQVLQIAKSDKIASKPTKKETKLSGSKFTIKVDKEEVKIDFSKGGTLRELYNIIDKQSSKIIRVTITGVDEDHEMLMIEGSKKGEKYRLVLTGDKTFFTEVGFVQPPKDKKSQFFPLKENKKEIIKGNYSIDEKEGVTKGGKLKNPKTAQKTKTEKKDTIVSLILDPESLIALPILKPIKITKTALLEAEIKIDDKKELIKKKDDKKLPPIGTVGKIEIDRIKLVEEPLIADLVTASNQQGTKNEKKKDPKQYISLSDLKDKEGKANFLSDSKGKWVKIKVELQKILKDKDMAKKILLANEFENKTFSIRKLKIHDPVEDSRKDNYNFLDKAQDAKLLMNGLEITREKNEISDLIRGVVLSLKSASDTVGTIKITRDYDKIVEMLQKFLDEYNNVMLFIKNVSDFVPKKTLAEVEAEEEKLARKSYEERQYAQLSGELYKGTMKDPYIRTLKQRLSRQMKGTPYTLAVKKEIKFLLQIGFKSPNPLESDIDRDNMKAGYLSLDKKILRTKLETHFDEVKGLFAHVKGEGVVKNNGIAINLVKTIDPYAKRAVKNGNGTSSLGMIAAKEQTLKSRVKRKKKRLESVMKRTGKKVDRLKRQLAKMKEAVRKGDAMKARLDGMFKKQ